MRRHVVCSIVLGALALAVMASVAQAQGTLKLAMIEPLSGGAASAGILSQKHFSYFVDKINAAGGVNGQKIELLTFDNKISPQESLIILKKVIDEGVRYVSQGVGSVVAHALTDAVLKHNERNPGKEVLYLNYAAVDPALTNEKCNFWHFRFDADADMKMEALTAYLAQYKGVKKVYLINQDYSFGKAVAAAARTMLKKKRPDVEIVGDELHPLQKVTDFSPYVAKIKASGADSVITGNWSNDMLLLIKAGKDAGLKVDWYTYYAGTLGSPTAIGRDGVGHVKQVTEWHKNVIPEADPDQVAYEKRFTGKEDDFAYWRMKTMFEMLVETMKKARSNDPVKVARALEGMKYKTVLGDVEMRADNHQLLQPLFISTMADKVKYDVEKTGLGFVTNGKVEAKDTATPSTCKMDRPK
ncbi:MAG: branched-chain amino acid ABC transporter substrate-binding protein [Candidatus Rokubacteria bacterium RIFCSPLOWO2_12_FULL_71_19]|nr:MAG: branched-chain amino acid ABC transporter substrate-binding protein [Candidatus Rokubacteria bacterium RIFCSPLOWO2_12_FULL_71_19]